MACCIMQVSSISGSDTDSSDEDDKEVDSENGDDHQTTARRASHAQASIQGAQAVFRTAGMTIYSHHYH